MNSHNSYYTLVTESKGTDDIRKQTTKAHKKNKIKKKQLEDNTHPLSLLQHPVKNQPPCTYPIPPTICNKNTIDIELFVQMRQSDKCESVKNDDIFNVHLGSRAGTSVSITCLLQDMSHIY